MPPTPVQSVRRAVLVLLQEGATAAETAPVIGPLRGQAVPLADGALALLFPHVDLAVRAALALLARKGGGRTARIGLAQGVVTAVGMRLEGAALDAARALAGRAAPGVALVAGGFRDAMGRELQPVAQLHEMAIEVPGERASMVFELVPATAAALMGGGFLSRPALVRNLVIAGLALALVLAALAGGWRPGP